jgi:protein-L-isoaspartate(D-aspartate) O-methyltransferase
MPSSIRGLFLGAAFLFLKTPPWLPAAETEPFQSGKQDPYQSARRQMVERDLKGRGIKDPRVLAAMEAVPRHLFVPDREKAAAYDDRPLPIGSGQTISQPYMVAYMSELLALKGDEKVLEIGTGSGYQAAVLGRLAGKVYSVEIVPSLSAQAQRRLEQLGTDNVELKIGDGFFGWEEKAPFDAILFTAASPKVPEPLWRQLREGGQIILPLGTAGQTQRLTRVRKTGGKQALEPLTEVIFVPLTGAIEKRSR